VRAITVVPGDSAGAKLSELPEPQPGPGDLLVEPVLLGVCGTNREIVDGVHGEAPEGADRLVLGHKLLARVRTAPDDSGAREATSSPASSGGPIPSPVPAGPVGGPSGSLASRFRVGTAMRRLRRIG
jgi:glucose 1-dehydrogenase